MSFGDIVLVLLWLATCALFGLIGWASRRPRGSGKVTFHINRPMTESEIGRLSSRANGTRRES